MLLINNHITTLTEEEVEEMITRFPLWRQTYIRRLKHFRSRRESAAAFDLLREGLLRTYGIKDFEFEYNENGKPFLLGHPEIHFNLSHCSTAVACALSQQPIGIDIERLGRYSEHLARHTMNEAEMAELLKASDDTENGFSERDQLFTCMWTQKEAISKLTGEGISTNVRHLLNAPTHYHLETTLHLDKGYVISTAEYASDKSKPSINPQHKQ